MGSILKLAAQPAKLGLNSADKNYVEATNNLMGLRLSMGRVVLVGGKADGQELLSSSAEGIVVEANQQVLIYPAATLNPIKYQTLISVNPVLLHTGMCSYASILEPGEGVDDLFIAYKAGRRTVLSDLKYLMCVYMID